MYQLSDEFIRQTALFACQTFPMLLSEQNGRFIEKEYIKRIKLC